MTRPRFALSDDAFMVRLPADPTLPVHPLGRGISSNDDPLRGLIDVLDHGRDGFPRTVHVEAPSASAADRLIARMTTDAESRGFVVLPVSSQGVIANFRPDELGARSLLLLAAPDVPATIAGDALLLAASQSARSHVLLRVLRAPTVVREARARYAHGSAAPLRRHALDRREIDSLQQRADRALSWIGTGRHAAAERVLRDVAGALHRRRYAAEAARVLVSLGRLLLERGACARADEALEQAAAAARLDGDHEAHVEARLWQATARLEAGRLTEAESLCRAGMLLPALSDTLRLRLHATLARLLLVQGRVREAGSVDLRPPTAEAEPRVIAFVRGTIVRLFLAQHRIFEAGVEARVIVEALPPDDLFARLEGESAHLCVLLAAGELTAGEMCLRTIETCARSARSPLSAVRARVLFARALHHAGRSDAARHQVRRLCRLSRAAPVFLRREIQDLDEAIREGSRVSPLRAHTEAPTAAELIAIAHEAEDDDDAIRQVLERLAAVCRTVRIDVWSHDAGPSSIVLTIGSGVATRIGARVLEAGVGLGPEPGPHGRELGVPVRRGNVLVSAISARWTLDCPPADDARSLFETAAAVVCGRLEARQSAARLATRTAAQVPELIGSSSAMSDVRATIARAAAAPFAVLIQGESGVGKELAARAIHQLSPRRERPFSDLNCAALPDDLFESELFGHARGAFTGAVTERPGLFESSSGGTLFLDEVADLSARGQAKLLRVLQQQEVRRIGETFSRPVDVRVIAAANRDLTEEAAAARFRSDLLYRLDVIRLRIPPLRERPEDIAPLALHLWRAAALRVGTAATLSHGALSALARYHWPGNVRELQNVVAALAVSAPSRGHVRAHLLPPAITGATYVRATRLAEARAQFERRAVESALARQGGNRSRAARELGLSRQGLLKMMARLGLS
jgi:DNA-binding NtrC family response regulator